MKGIKAYGSVKGIMPIIPRRQVYVPVLGDPTHKMRFLSVFFPF